jgi:hypothetical protein
MVTPVDCSKASRPRFGSNARDIRLVVVFAFAAMLSLANEFLATPAFAEDFGMYTPIARERLPEEIRPFVEPGTRAIAIERSDLNGDGRQDALLVLQANAEKDDGTGFMKRARPLLILTRDAKGTLRLRKRNDKMVLCPECGGVHGDPLVVVEAKTKSFRIEHYGGSGWRWVVNYQFNYSRRDDTWQLVRIEETSFHISEPDEPETDRVRTPPKDYGKIDIADFDPDALDD